MSNQADDKTVPVSGERGTGTPEWKVFDAAWYRRRYQSVLDAEEKQATDQKLEDLWKQTVRETGRSPNRFFDEKWYLSYNSDVGRQIRAGGIFETGFQHYEDIGFKSCSPHWLFREEDYFRRNCDLSYRDILSQGFVNGYDHYLKCGDKEGRQANLYFQPELFVSQLLREGMDIDVSQGAFRTYLSLEDERLGQMRTSWYFDPQWYLRRYPEVEECIRTGRYGLPLEHYLCNDEPTRFDPNPHFSEIYYLAQYPDIEKAVAEGRYRNGYEHFLTTGLYEGRRPQQGVELDLGVMKGGRSHLLADYNVEDAFALYVRQKEEKFSIDLLSCSVEAARKLAITRLEAHLPALYRNPLVFDTSWPPELTVILCSEGDYLSVTASLLSLYEQGFSGQEIMVVSNGTVRERHRLEKTFKNVTFLYPAEWKTDKGLFLKGVQLAKCEQILLLYAGVTVHQNALSVIFSSMAERDITGGGGQVIAANQKVLETGCHIFRDGSVKVYGKGEKAFSPDISFARQVDGFQRGAFFGRREAILPLLAELAPFEDKTGFLSLTCSLSAMGNKLVYCPDLLLTDLETGRAFELPASVPDLFKENFPSYLAEEFLPSDQRTPFFNKEKNRTILIVYERLPLASEGGFSRRAFDLIEILHKEGWEVSLLALHEGPEDRLTPLQSYPSSVKWFVGEDYLQDFFVKGHVEFDLVWVNGSSIAAQLMSLVKPFLRSEQNFILDITTLEGNGLRASESYLRRCVGGQDNKELFLAELRQKLSDAWLCRAVITDNDWEADHIRQAGIFNVVVIPNRFRAPGVTPQMEGRSGLLFPVPLYKSGDAAHDGFDWFCLNVLPALRDILPEDIPLWVGAYHNPAIDLAFYERFVPVKGLTKPLPLAEIMEQCRLAVVPTRVMATITPEILDVMEAGLPAVMSSPVMKELGFTAGEEGIDGGFNDPQSFALAIAELYTDEALWNRISKAASEKITASYSKEHFRSSVLSLLAQLENPVFQSYPLKISRTSPARRFQPAPLILSGEVSDEPNAAKSVEDVEEANDRMPGIRLGVTLET
ncbi:glycosyltransferase family 4 protein [Acetobacteraceae bacterium ESL0709]|nr:glycosyltransferase family 4 protein [Acetobacteraceae bacterium ESL0697]MDF7678011.1 glycosyltransferase family 4 protein [Acetobacteraceae bacterium ESL0709]